MHIGHSVPRFVWYVIGILALFAALPALATYVSHEMDSAVGTIQGVAIKVGIGLIVLGGTLHFSPWHRAHGVQFIEGAVIGLAVIFLGPAVVPHLSNLAQHDAPHWIDGFFGLFGL